MFFGTKSNALKRRFIGAIMAVAVSVGVAIVAAPQSSAAPASPIVTGNGTSNFYLTGSCDTYLVGGGYLSFTDYDNGPNQTYHIATSNSGVAYTTVGVYINNVYKGKGADFFVNMPGHGAYTVKLVTKQFSSHIVNTDSCSVTR